MSNAKRPDTLNSDSPNPESIDLNAPPGEYIKLDQFLKLADLAQTGGQAKSMIVLGEVKVNGEIETRRGRKLRDGDTVEVAGELLVVQVTN